MSRKRRRSPAASVARQETHSHQWRFFGAGALVLMVMAAYVPAMRCGFIWDDDQYVYANSTLTHLDGLRRIWLEPRASPQYYPLVFTSFWVEYHFWGVRPFGYHVVNVLIHSAGAVLLWAVLRRMTVSGAWLAAAVFALHPVHVESVAWITERKNVLSGALYLAAMYVYLVFDERRQERTTSGGIVRPFALAFCLFVGALLSKSVTCSLPAAILLILYWRRGRVTVRDAGPLLIFFVLGLTAAISTVWLERAHVGAVGPDFEIPLLQRTLMAGRAVWFYLGKLLWPHPLMFTYPKWNIDSADLVAYVYLLGAVALVISLWRLRKRIGAGPLVATLYFGGTLLPALGFFNLYPLRYSPVADHFQYLASIGPITLIAALAVRATRTLPLSWRGAAAAGVLAVLAILTWRQCGTYSDEETLWKRTLDRNPTAWIAHNNLGAICAARDEVDAAVGHFTKAVTLNPHAPEIRNNFGMFLLKRGQVAEAEEHVRQAIRLDTRRDDAQSNLGVILLNQGKLEAAADQFARALRLNPYNVSARFNLGCTLSALGRWDEAIAHLQEAARLDPADVETREHLARALEQKARSAGGTRTP